jgi:glycosyltransferase involved in cell wall biosynthesis
MKGATSDVATSDEPTAHGTKASRATQEHDEVVDAHVVLLTHYIPLYQVRVFQELAKRVRKLTILLSTPIEPNRQFELDWGGLDVRVQRSMQFRRRWKHTTGFHDELYVHVPYDTLFQLRRLQPDIVLSLELGMRSAACSLYRMTHRRSRLGLLVYVSEHTEQGRGGARGLLRRWLVRRADAISYNGPSGKRYLRGLGVADGMLYPFPYAADDRTAYRGPLARQASDAHRLLYVGQLNERKGVLPMVEQLAQWATNHRQQVVELRIAGSGPLASAIEQTPRPANFHLEMLGNVPATALGNCLATHGAMVMPTLADEWGVVVNEALQAGLPIIGSRYAQAVETLIRDRENGFAFLPDQPESFHQALDWWFALDHHQVEALRPACRETVAAITPQNAGGRAAAICRSLMSQLRQHARSAQESDHNDA